MAKPRKPTKQKEPDQLGSACASRLCLEVCALNSRYCQLCLDEDKAHAGPKPKANMAKINRDYEYAQDVHTFDHLTDYQRQAKTFDMDAHDPRDTKMVHLLGLAGEVGEFLDKIKKNLRDGGARDHTALKLELGDILWYIAIVSDDLGMTLADVASSSIVKLTERRNRGVLRGSGDNR